MNTSNKENCIQGTVCIVREDKPSYVTSILINKKKGSIIRFSQKLVPQHRAKFPLRIHDENKQGVLYNSTGNQKEDNLMGGSNFHKLKKEAQKLDIDDQKIQRFSTLDNPVRRQLPQNFPAFCPKTKKNNPRKIVKGRPEVYNSVKKNNQKVVDYNKFKQEKMSKINKRKNVLTLMDRIRHLETIRHLNSCQLSKNIRAKTSYMKQKVFKTQI